MTPLPPPPGLRLIHVPERTEENYGTWRERWEVGSEDADGLWHVVSMSTTSANEAVELAWKKVGGKPEKQLEMFGGER